MLSLATRASGAVPTTEMSDAVLSASVRSFRTIRESSTIRTRIGRVIVKVALPALASKRNDDGSRFHLETLPHGEPVAWSCADFRRRQAEPPIWRICAQHASA